MNRGNLHNETFRPNRNSFCSVIVAGGSGSRFGGDLPKQFSMLDGRPVLRWSVDAFARCPELTDMVIVSHPDWMDETARTVESSPAFPRIRIVPGGTYRQDSCRIGLQALECDAGRPVLIHDAARPWVSERLIRLVLSALQAGCAAVIPVLPVRDSLVVIRNNLAIDYADRSTLGHVQTPQGFVLETILAEHNRMFSENSRNFTDDASIMLAAGYPVSIVPGDPQNRKITVWADLNPA